MKRSSDSDPLLLGKKSRLGYGSTRNDYGTQKHDVVLSTKDTGENILKFLPASDKCTMALVSNTMHTLASDPCLWDRMTLNQNKLRDEGLAQYFSDCKFVRFKALKLCGIVTKKDGQALLDQLSTPGNKIEEVDFSECESWQIPAPMLAKIVTKLAKVNLFTAGQFLIKFRLTESQCFKVLKEIGYSVTPILKELRLRIPGMLNKKKLMNVLEMSKECEAIKEFHLGFSYDLNKVPAELLATTIAKMEKVSFDYYQERMYAFLTEEQTIAIFDKVAESTSLVELDIGNSLWHMKLVSPESLAKTMAKLRKVKLFYCTDYQMEEIFVKMSISKKLEELWLIGNNLSDIQIAQLPSIMKGNVGKSRSPGPLMIGPNWPWIVWRPLEG